MQSFFENYLKNLLELHDEIRNAIRELPQDALDWTPGTEMNATTVLVFHLTGAERYWIGDVICGDPSGRDRDAEFKVHGKSADELFQCLGETENYLQSALETLSLSALDEKRTSPRNGREVTVGWALLHALKHTALHLGHIQLTRQMWEMPARFPKE